MATVLQPLAILRSAQTDGTALLLLQAIHFWQLLADLL